jgi:CRP-like cAMP-binding protein
MDHGELDRTITASWLGPSLPPGAAEALLALARTRTVAPGSLLLAEGAETTELGIVVRGRLALTEQVPGRGPVPLLTVGPGDLYGWSALLPPFRATSTVTAPDGATVQVLPAQELRAAMAADPALASIVYRHVLDAVARRLLATRQQVLDLYRLEIHEPW